jgi:site-specific DNA recombinase
VKERLARLQKEAAAASDRAAQRAELRLLLDHLDSFAHQVREGLDNVDWNTRREIICSLVKSIKIETEQVRITYRINPRPFDGGPGAGQFRQLCDYRVSCSNGTPRGSPSNSRSY